MKNNLAVNLVTSHNRINNIFIYGVGNMKNLEKEKKLKEMKDNFERDIKGKSFSEAIIIMRKYFMLKYNHTEKDYERVFNEKYNIR